MALVVVLTAPAEAFQPQRTQDLNESMKMSTHAAQTTMALAPEFTGRDAGLALAVDMTPQLADNLALLFDKFGDAEFIVCLEGERTAAGGLELRDFRMPHMAYSRATSAAVYPDGGCEQYDGIVGTLHNHPPAYPEDRGRESANCYLSRPDITSWLEGSEYPYTAVMCGPRTWAWWHRSQVDASKVLAFPKQHQLHDAETEVRSRT